MSTTTTQKLAKSCTTAESVWDKLIAALNQIPEIQVFSSVNNEKVTAINLRVTSFRGLKFIRDVFTIGRNANSGTSVWESWIWDAGYEGGAEDVFIHSHFTTPKGGDVSIKKDIFLFYTLRHVLKTGYATFGLFTENI